jgi:DNA-binding NtrC family response regulator
MLYDFPGNVRELKNIINGACIFCESDQIKSSDLWITSGGINQHEVTEGDSTDNNDSKERALMLKILKMARWNRKKAAEMLQMPYSTFRYKMRKYSITRKSSTE